MKSKRIILAAAISILPLSSFADANPAEVEALKEICEEFVKLKIPMAECDSLFGVDVSDIKVEKLDNLLDRASTALDAKIIPDTCPAPAVQRVIDKVEDVARMRKRDRIKAKFSSLKGKIKGFCK